MRVLKLLQAGITYKDHCGLVNDRADSWSFIVSHSDVGKSCLVIDENKHSVDIVVAVDT